jgi:hypothetical protein
LACAGAATSARGQVWNEVGDATESLPGQTTVGVGSLTTIRGTINSLNGGVQSEWVDAYRIYIPVAADFRASTRNAVTDAGVGNTQLFLFDQNGFGITMNDDDPAGGTVPGGSPSQSVITGAFVPGPGYYMLAVSAYPNIDVGLPGQDLTPTFARGADGMEIWSPFSPRNAELAPTGAHGPLVSWSHNMDPYAIAAAYQIDLQGASFAQAPAPGAAVLLGLGGLLVSRRRR